MLQRAAGLEQHSEHALAHGIISAARERNLRLTNPERVQAFPGSGILGYVEGDLVAVGRGEWIREQGLNLPSTLSERLLSYENSGQTAVCVGWSGKVNGLLLLDDLLLPEARATVQALRSLKLQTLLLTGDLPAVAQRIAESAGIEEWQAGFSPEEKRNFLAQWSKRNGCVAMVGDGLNDGPVLASAEVGIAVGTATDLARETADLVLPKGGLTL